MKKTFLVTSLMAVGASILFTGCATLFGGGSTQTINVQSSKNTTIDMYKIKTQKNQETGEIKENSINNEPPKEEEEYNPFPNN